MKLILTLLIFSCLFCKGQDTSRSASMNALLKMMKDSGIVTMPLPITSRVSYKDTIILSEYDTVKVVMLVCNIENKYSLINQAQAEGGFRLDSNWTIVTNSLNKDFYECDFDVHWQYGYSVHQRSSIYVSYLDAEKKEIPKNIIVWMAKEIQK